MTTWDHPAALPVDDLRAQCTSKRTRRSGPGGQHRNKVETAVVLTHEPTGVTAEASERRSQAENLKAALFRLRVNLALAVRRPRAADAPPSALWSSRCRNRRLAVNAAHADFPALLAEALDTLAAHEHDVPAAAAALACSASQFVRLLRSEPRGLANVNQRRAELGLRPLR